MSIDEVQPLSPEESRALFAWLGVQLAASPIPEPNEPRARTDPPRSESEFGPVRADVLVRLTTAADGERPRDLQTRAEWVDWFNNKRLFGPLGDVSPREFEASFYEEQDELAMVA